MFLVGVEERKGVLARRDRRVVVAGNALRRAQDVARDSLTNDVVRALQHVDDGLRASRGFGPVATPE